MSTREAGVATSNPCSGVFVAVFIRMVIDVVLPATRYSISADDNADDDVPTPNMHTARNFSLHACEPCDAKHDGPI